MVPVLSVSLATLGAQAWHTRGSRSGLGEKRDLRSRTQEGEWFFCLDRFVFTGKK